MKKSIKVTPQKLGRPFAGGRNPLVPVRMPPSLIEDVDTWGKKHDAGRSEAIRRLVEIGLKAKTK